MSETARAIDLAKNEGRNWFEESLGGGFGVSAAVLASISFDIGRFFAFVSSDMDPEQIKFPGYPDVRGGGPALALYLDDLTSGKDLCLLIEDEAAERGDPNIEEWSVPSAFIGDRVVHWFDLKPGSGAAAMSAINESSSGYPLNAFVVTRTSTELGLVNRGSLANDIVDTIASSILAIVVAAFDATSFAVWECNS